MNSTDLWDILDIFQIHTRLFYSRSLILYLPPCQHWSKATQILWWWWRWWRRRWHWRAAEETTKMCSIRWRRGKTRKTQGQGGQRRQRGRGRGRGGLGGNDR